MSRMAPEAEKIGNMVKHNLTSMYQLYELLLMKKISKYRNSDQRAEMDHIIIYGLLSYDNPKSASQVIAAIKRLDLKRFTEEITMDKVIKGVTLAGAVLGAGAKVYSLINNYLENIKRQKAAIRNKEKLKRIYKTVYSPELQKIYIKMMNGQIKTEHQLQMSFYRLADKISVNFPSVAPYVEEWNI